MNLKSHLATLESGGLIRAIPRGPELEYLFRHALIQETAYDSLVKADRRMLHQAIGESLERLYPARLASADLAPMLAHHFDEAGDEPRALHYYTLAGRAAAAIYANAEAIEHYGRALQIATAQAAGSEVVVDLFLRRGRALELNAQDAAALANYEALEAWAAQAGDRSAQLAALAARATIYVKPSVEQNLPLGYDLSQTALALVGEIGDRPAAASVRWNLLQYYLAAGKMYAALENGEQALAIAREQNLREQIAYVLTDLHKAYFQTAQLDRAQAALDEAQALWRELGMLNMLADNLASSTLMQIVAGDYDRALAQSQEALQVSRAIGNLWNQSYSIYAVDLVHFDRGDIGEAVAVAEACRQLARQAGFAEGIYQSSFDLALIYSSMGALAPAREALGVIWGHAGAPGGQLPSSPHHDALAALLHLREGRLAEAQAVFEAAQIPEDFEVLKGWFILTHMFVTGVRAELALAAGLHQRVVTLSDQLIPYLRQLGARLFLADVVHLKGRALLAAGRLDEARAALLDARAEAEDLGSRRSLWEILADLAVVEAAEGDEAAALALRRQAAEIIDYIAVHAGSTDLRESFLGLSDVRGVLDQTEKRAA